MPGRLKIVLLLFAPIAVAALLFAIDRTFGITGRGHDYVIRIALPPADGLIGLPKVYGPADASRPLVVLDPGHGGLDPGAGQGQIREKAVTLEIARQIRDGLLREGGVRVALTRDDDSYLMLAERTSIARRLGADLFLSIHADSASSPEASGASVYVLSEKGSNEAAARFAARENGADSVNGVRLANQTDVVSTILLELSQSEAQAGSDELARLIIREIGGKMKLHDRRVQSAAFAVLKSPDIPSVLFETGYISNEGDAAYLISAEGRETIAQAASRAVRAFLARQSGL